MSAPLKLAVVGHTNVGKTSLLRTLLRDVSFGEVSHRPSTTRHVEGARLSVGGQTLIELFDTPGLEDSIALLEYLEGLAQPQERLDGPALIERFLQTAEAAQRFEQEAKVLRQLLKSDAGLYVIDAREPVLAKYRDELAVLALCGKPLLPVLNFMAGNPASADAWRQALARLGLHALVRFDTITPPHDGEQLLYQSLALLIENRRSDLEHLIESHNRQAEARETTGRRLIAELLIDCAACRRLAPNTAIAVEALHEAVRQHEQHCVEGLLRLYAFRSDDADTGQLPLLDGRWGSDLFNPETLRQVGLTLGGGMAAGAATGLGVDLLTGGLTLGGATVLGALIGGSVQTLRTYGERLRGQWRGTQELTVDDAILQLLALRQMQLLSALAQRGHAAQAQLRLNSTDTAQWRQGRLPDPLRKARAHPEWSALNAHARLEKPAREAQTQLLMAQLQGMTKPPPQP